MKTQIKNVLDLYLRYCKQNDYDLQKVSYVGNDLAVIKIVGLPVALSDAHPEVIGISYLVIKAKGGDGDGVVKNCQSLLPKDIYLE